MRSGSPSKRGRGADSLSSRWPIPRLKEYGLHTHYILSACEVAYSVYRNKGRKSDPYIERAFLKLDNQSYSLNHLLLRIPTTPRHFVYLTLQGLELSSLLHRRPDPQERLHHGHWSRGQHRLLEGDCGDADWERRSASM